MVISFITKTVESVSYLITHSDHDIQTLSQTILGVEVWDRGIYNQFQLSIYHVIHSCLGMCYPRQNLHCFLRECSFLASVSSLSMDYFQSQVLAASQIESLIRALRVSESTNATPAQ